MQKWVVSISVEGNLSSLFLGLGETDCNIANNHTNIYKVVFFILLLACRKS